MKINVKAILFHPIIAATVVGALVTLAMFAGFLLAQKGVNTPYLFVLPAAVLCCDFYGFRYSLWAAIVGTISAWFFFVTPVWTFEPPSLGDFIELMGFLGATLFVCWIIEEQRNMIRELEKPRGMTEGSVVAEARTPDEQSPAA